MISKHPIFSIFSKLVVSFLIVIIPVYFASYAINQQGKERLRQEINSSMQSKAQFYLSLLDAELDRIIRQQRELANDEDLAFLSNASIVFTEYEKVQAIHRLQKQLFSMKESSTYIEDVTVDIPELGYHFNAFNNVTDIDPNELKAMTENRENQLIFTWGGHIYIAMLYPTILYSEQTPVFVVAVELSTTELRKTLDQFSLINGLGHAMLYSPHWTAGDLSDPVFQQLITSSALTNHGKTPMFRTIDIHHQPMNVYYVKSSLLNFYLLNYVPENEIIKPLEKYQRWSSIQFVISVLIVLLFSAWIYRLIHRPLTKLVNGFRKVERGEFNYNLTQTRRDEFGYLYQSFNLMTVRLKELIDEVYEQKYRLELSELKQLQSQINPHFLYNCFYNLYRMAKREETEQIAVFVNLLGNFYQFVTRVNNDEATLEDEVQHARNYVEIQSIRFRNRIDVRFDELPQSCGSMPVPRLILQPLIENAYNHGLEDLETGTLEIGFEVKATILLITVEDNGRGMEAGKLASLQRQLDTSAQALEYHGICNVHRRLQLKLGTSAGVTLEQGKNGGLKVTLTIPLLQEKWLDV